MYAYDWNQKRDDGAVIAAVVALVEGQRKGLQPFDETPCWNTRGHSLQSLRQAAVDALRRTATPEGMQEVCLLSRRYAEKLISEAEMSTLCALENDADRSVRDAAKDSLRSCRALLQAPPNITTTYLPIPNASMTSDEFTFGNVTFLRPTETVLESLLEEYTKIADQTLDSQCFKRRVIRQVADEIIAYGSRSGALARVTICAFDDEAAQNIARVILSSTLDILNFFIERLMVNGSALYLEGESGFSQERAMSFREDHASWGWTLRGLRPVDFSDFLSKANDSPEYSSISRLLSRSRRTNLERQLLVSIRLVGRSRKAISAEDELLHCMYALEGLLTPNSRGEIQYRLSIRTAHLMADDPDSRKVLQTWIASRYNDRSLMVHQGKSKSGDTSHARCLRNLVGDAITLILTDTRFARCTEVKQVEDLIDELVMGYQPDRA